MKRDIFIVVLIISLSSATSQTYEIGVVDNGLIKRKINAKIEITDSLLTFEVTSRNKTVPLEYYCRKASDTIVYFYDQGMWEMIITKQTGKTRGYKYNRLIYAINPTMYLKQGKLVQDTVIYYTKILE